jgi:hypothetical protein
MGIGPNAGFPVHTGSPSCGRYLLSPLYSTTLPGQGERMSTFSLVMQPFTLVMNIGGKASGCLGVLSDEFDGGSLTTVMGAQFMYITRLPIRLNHVQARVYFPGATPRGSRRGVVQNGPTRHSHQDSRVLLQRILFVGLDDFPVRILCRLAITGEAHLAGPTAMGGAAQKLDGIVAPSPISRLFSRNGKVTWGYLARKVTTICSKWRVAKCLSTRSVGLGRRHSQACIGQRECNCLQKQTPFHVCHSRRRDGLLWSNTSYISCS